MPDRRRRARLGLVATVAACLALAVAGCSTSEESTVPVACATSAEAVKRALASAPEPVRLDGTPISDCFARSSDTAAVQTLGFALTDAAAALAARARNDPEGDAALELGYLIGAVREGASRTQGIHDELLRRLEQELRGVDTSSAAFTAGERAARESG